MLEGLELDQYMWGILEQLSKSEIDEINIDANASWKPSISKMVVKEEDNKGKNVTSINQVFAASQHF